MTEETEPADAEELRRYTVALFGEKATPLDSNDPDKWRALWHALFPRKPIRRRSTVNISDRTTSSMVMTAVNGLEAKAPKAIIDGYEEANRVSAAARSLGAGREDLGIAVYDALTAGRDPGLDPEVQRVLVASQIANEGVVATVESIAFERFRQVCVEHADATVLAWRKPFDQAATTLTASFAKLGPLDPADSDAVLRRGADAADSWAAAQRASQVIEAIRGGWVALGEFTRTVPINADYRVLQLAAVSFSEWNQHELRRRKLTPWEYILLGIPLTLPNAVEYRSRVQTIADALALETEAAASPADPERAGLQAWTKRVEGARKVEATK